MFTLSSSEGSMLREGALHGSPSMAKFYNPPEGTSSDGNLDEPKLSIVLDNKTLYLFNMKDPESPIELAFQDKYGTIVSYDWCVRARVWNGGAAVATRLWRHPFADTARVPK